MAQNHQLLTQGQTVVLHPSGRRCVVGELLGKGTQGEVFRATVEGVPHDVALKWYFARYVAMDPTLRQRLDVAARDRAPDRRFLWPLEIATLPGSADFGYVMRLRDPAFVSLSAVVKRIVSPTYFARATTGFQLADSLLALHAKGFCYRDINFENLFLHPRSGDALICDNDNVDVDGVPGPVAGTPSFMAPEILRGEAPPRIQTDLHALAVLLFYLFHLGHPMHGRMLIGMPPLDFNAIRYLCGLNPVFIFDPVDRLNEAVAGESRAGGDAIAVWQRLPGFTRTLFLRAFTEGLKDPLAGRVRESEWRRAMVELRDLVVECPACGAESFVDPAWASTPTIGCWRCGGAIGMPPRLVLRKAGSKLLTTVVLAVGREIFPHHVDEARGYDFGKPVGVVEAKAGGGMVLRNGSGEKWVVRGERGELREVGVGEAAEVRVGGKVFFGKVEGEVVE